MNVSIFEVNDSKCCDNVYYIAIAEDELLFEDIEGFVFLTDKAKEKFGIPKGKIAVFVSQDKFLVEGLTAEDSDGVMWRYDRKYHYWKQVG